MITAGSADITENRIAMRNRNMVLEAENTAGLLAALTALPGLPAVNLLDFRRGCGKVKAAMLGAIAALYDAGAFPSDRIALIGTGSDGSRTENLAYYQDYTEHGRDGGRGQLFVGTLPTTPLCEAAIALSLLFIWMRTVTTDSWNRKWHSLSPLPAPMPFCFSISLFPARFKSLW